MTHARTNLSGSDFAKLSSTAGAGDFSMKSKIFDSYVPPELMGAQGLSGGSILSSVAHRAKQMSQMNNLINNGVDDELYIKILDKNKHPITTPYMFEGKMRYPNLKGEVRLANYAPVDLAKQVKKYEEEQTDILMDKFMCGDDVAAYVVGMTKGDWDKICGKGGCPEGCDMSKEMKEEICTISHIESLVSGSITQTRALSKLRKIAKHFLRNVNLESFDSFGEKKADMALGKNKVGVSDEIQDELTKIADAQDKGAVVPKR